MAGRHFLLGGIVSFQGFLVIALSADTLKSDQIFFNPFATGAVRITPDGAILVGQNGPHDQIQITRLTDNGRFDESFAQEGVLDVTEFFQSSFGDMQLEGTGNLIVAGTSRTSGTDLGSYLLARFTSAGSLDTSFGVNGFQVMTLTNPLQPFYVDTLTLSATAITFTGTILGHQNELSTTMPTIVSSTVDGQSVRIGAIALPFTIPYDGVFNATVARGSGEIIAGKTCPTGGNCEEAMLGFQPFPGH